MNIIAFKGFCLNLTVKVTHPLNQHVKKGATATNSRFYFSPPSSQHKQWCTLCVSTAPVPVHLHTFPFHHPALFWWIKNWSNFWQTKHGASHLKNNLNEQFFSGDVTTNMAFVQQHNHPICCWENVGAHLLAIAQ